MTNPLHHFAVEATSDDSIFGALGIDLKMLLLQAVGFLILVWLLGKYVFPILLKQVDERQSKIEEGTKAAEQAEKKAAEAEAKIEATMKKARSEAADIVSTAKDEATQMVEKAELQAKTRSERIVTEAHESIEKDVLKARETLKKDTLELVKQASSIVTAGVVDSKLDATLLKQSLEGVKK